SSQRRDIFSAIAEELDVPPLQLICDVETRWSSVYLMIKRAVILREAIDRFIQDEGGPDPLDEDDWMVLKGLQRILQIPFWYQQILSYQKTPTLCGTLAAFEVFINSLNELAINLMTEGLDIGLIIKKGTKKIESYSTQAIETPVHLLSMVLNPMLKLEWFKQHYPSYVAETAKYHLLDALRPLYTPSRA
ncbi:hypothetical protein EDB87DRAFT_1729366, partial [Lactarius vividus]